MERTEPLEVRSLRAVWHPCTQMKLHERQPPLPLAHAEGVWLYDTAGRRYLDAVSSWWVNLFGHGHPHIGKSLADQFHRLDHVMLAGCTHAPVVELSERLAALTGLGRASYASDGASGVEIALKMSAHCWRNLGRPEKSRFIGLAGGYHGETVGALSVTDIDAFRAAYAPLVRISAVLPCPDSRGAPAGVSAAQHARHCAAALEAYLEVHHSETAAMIVEPLVQCASGMAMHDPEYLRRARASCDRFGVHLVADEIAVGFGRTGSLFAYQQAGIRPDFVCLSKGLTGGCLPLAAVLTTDEVYRAFYDDRPGRAFLHSHSYTGNPLACRAALATLDLFDRDDVLARNRQTAARLTELARPLAQHPRVLRSRQLGMIWAFDVDVDVADDPGFAQRFHVAALARGVLLRPIGATVYFMPPYVIDEGACAWLVQGCLEALEECLRGTVPAARGAGSPE